MHVAAGAVAVRRLLLAAVLPALVPAPASAAGGFAVVAGPVRVRGYEMTVTGLVRDSGSPAIVNVVLERNIGKRVRLALGGKRFRQEHSFLADHGAAVTVATDLRSASISVGLGRYGQVALAVKAPPPRESDE